jgi:hypothetical protein
MADSASMELVWETNRIPEFVGKMAEASALGLDTWAGETLQEADAAAPTDTGGLRASRYRITALTNEFGSATSAFTARNPKGHPASEPQVDVAGGEVAIGYAAGYARPVNDGHHTRSGGFVAANPFFDNAVQGNIGTIHDKIAEALGKIL